MINKIIAFSSYKNKYPNSLFEQVGDAFLTPISTLCGRNSFVVLKNDKTGNRFIYTATNNSKSSLRVVVELIISMVTVPFTLVGIMFKGLSLITSKETRDIYINWQNPLKAQFNNPDKILDNYFWDGRRIVGLAQRGANFVNLSTNAIEKGCASQLLDELLRHPREYLVETYDEVLGDQVWLPPSLNECSCVNSGNFNRFKNRRRLDLEKQLISDAIKSFPPSESIRLNYVGFGAGKLLQDFINIAKLMKAGYKDINVTLIDPILKSESAKVKSDKQALNPAVEQFNFLLKAAEQKGIKLQINQFKNITEYRKKFPKEKAHIISAIDFDDYDKAFNDIILCHQILHTNGKFYLSYSLHDFCFGSTQCISNKNLWKKNSLFVTLFENIQKDVEMLSKKLSQKGQKTIRYAQLETNFNFEEWTNILPKLALDCDKIEFTLIQPPEKNFFGVSIGKPNAQFTEKNLEYYLKLFVPTKTKVKVHLVDSLDSFKKYVKRYQTKFDIITLLGYASDDEQSAKENVRWLRQHASDGNIYFGVDLYQKSTQESHPDHQSFQGEWRWNADLGTKLLLPTMPEYKTVIDDMMRAQAI